jgi:antitoxin Phd
MTSWQVQDAKARFSEFLDATLEQGPQVVTRRGVKAAVLVPIEEWNRLQNAARPSLKTLLLAPEGRTENLIAATPAGTTRTPETRKLRRRAVLKF